MTFVAGRLACLRDGQPGQLHQLVDGEGAGAHELLVERGGGLCGEGLGRVRGRRDVAAGRPPTLKVIAGLLFPAIPLLFTGVEGGHEGGLGSVGWLLVDWSWLSGQGQASLHKAGGYEDENIRNEVVLS